MSLNTIFEQQLIAAGTTLLADKVQSAEHCNPATSEAEQALMGQHLSTKAAEKIKEKVTALLEKFARLVEKALLDNEEAITKPHIIAEGNALLNAAHSGKVTPFEGDFLRSDAVEAGLIDNLKTTIEPLIADVIRILTRVKESSPNFEYVLDLRISKEPKQGDLLIQDIEILFTDIMALKEIAKKIGKAMTAHNAKDISEERYSNQTMRDAMAATESSTLKESRANVQLLQNHFVQISSSTPPTPIAEELITYYKQTFEGMLTIAKQCYKLFEAERLDPGMIEYDSNDQLICRSYAERLRTYIEVYRYMILTMNNARRMQLLLECT